MERERAALGGRQGGRRVLNEDVEKVLQGVCEHDLIVLPRLDGRRELVLHRWVVLELLDDDEWVEFEQVVHIYCFLAGFGDECYADLDFEFSPTAAEMSGQTTNGTELDTPCF